MPDLPAHIEEALNNLDSHAINAALEHWMPVQETERRHLELLAATIAAGYASANPNLHSENIAEWAVADARAIQEEVRRD